MEYDILSAIHPDYNCSKIIGNYENIPVDRIETGDIVRYVTRTGASFKKVIYSGRLSESRFPNMFMAYPSKYFICDYSKIISVIRDEESARICSNGS